MGCEVKDSSATARRQDGHRTARVEVTLECTTDGYEAALEPTNEGVIDDPALIVLRLTVTEPDAGPDVMTLETAVWEGDIDDEVERVTVRVDGAADVNLTIADED